MVCIKHSSKDMHPCILLAYCITSHGVYQAFISSKHMHHCILLAYCITSHGVHQAFISSKHMHHCILLAYCITSHGVYQAFISSKHSSLHTVSKLYHITCVSSLHIIKTHASLHTVSILYHCMININHSSNHVHPCILLAYWITSHLSMHHSPLHCTNMQHFCDLKFASCHALYMLHHPYASHSCILYIASHS